MSFSNYLETAIMNHFWGGTSQAQPAGHYVKLHVGDPGEDGTANAAVETTRQEVTSWTGAADVRSNGNLLQWLSVAATETYTHVSIWDAVTGGNCLGSGTLSGGAVTAGQNFEIPIGDLDVTAA